jgi:transposase
MGTAKRYSKNVREGAVRLELEQQAEHGSPWPSILSVSAKICCAAQSLHRWVAQAERNLGQSAGLTGAERDDSRSLSARTASSSDLIPDFSATARRVESEFRRWDWARKTETH